MEHRKKIKLFKDLYGYTVGICITDDILKSSNELDKKFGGDGNFEKPCHGMHFYLESSNFSMIFLKKNSCAGNIAHEAWHCIRRMFEYNEQSLDNETVAYNLGYLIDEITEFLNKVKSEIP